MEGLWKPLRTALMKIRKMKPTPTPLPTPNEPDAHLYALPLAAAAAILLALGLAAVSRKKKQLSPAAGTSVAAALAFCSVSAAAVSFPFYQSRRDALGCDALCQGGQTSLRSGLTLVGASLIGRASDRFGRIPMLWIGLAATLIGLMMNLTLDSLNGMWYAIIPVALLNQNFSVSKALLTDYVESAGGSKADVAGAVGKLGMAVGLSFMVGPVISTLLVKTYREALVLSAVLTSLTAVLIALLPTPKRVASAEASAGCADAAASSSKSAASGLMAFFRMPVLQTRGAQLLMAIRLLMAFAFHMWAPVWQVSIRKRFDFQPQDHARFMGLIGLSYALSQGAISKPLIRRAGKDPTKLLVACLTLLGGLRPIALYTGSIHVVYVLYVFMVIALGVMNTAIAAACSSLAEGDQLGGLFGVLESVEAVAGMLGPTLGGLAARTHDDLPLSLVLACYASALVLVSLFFGQHVIKVGGDNKKTL